MLVTFLDKISGFVDRRFMVAFWAPFFLFSACCVGISISASGGTRDLIARWIENSDSSQALLVALGFLLTVTVGAYVLQAFAAPLIQIYEGYWPRLLFVLINWSSGAMQSSLDSLKKRAGLVNEEDDGQDDSQDYEKEPDTKAEKQLQQQAKYLVYLRFPKENKWVRATRLGNVLTAAEAYALEMYGIETVLWWPRLMPLLPELVRAQIDTALTALLALLNLSTLFFLLAALALGTGLVTLNLTLFIVGTLTFLALARMCYGAATMQASDYGQQVRVAFDLYRSEILRQMRLPVPDSPPSEVALWKALTTWIYDYVPPLAADWPPKSKEIEGCFQYASEKKDQPRPLQVNAEVRLGDQPRELRL